MIKAWALIEMDDSILGAPFATKELAENAKASLSYFGDMVSVEEIDFNTEELTEAGKERQEVLNELLKDTISLHISKGRDFYSFSPDRRIEFLINMLSQRPTETVDTNTL